MMWIYWAGLSAFAAVTMAPTTRGRPRSVPILDDLAIVLREWRSVSPVPDLVFYSRSGARLRRDHRVVRSTFQRTISDAAIAQRNVTFHDLRHTFASHWVMRNRDIYRPQRILGHHDLRITPKYAHLFSATFVSDRCIKSYAEAPPNRGSASVSSTDLPRPNSK